MGNLTDAMRSMADDLRTGSQAQAEAFHQLNEDIKVRVSEIRSDTHNLLQRFAGEHAERKRAVNELKKADAERKRTVNELKAGVGEMIGDFQKADAERKRTVNELKAGVGEMIGDFQKAGAERKQTVNELKAGVGEMIGDFQKAGAERKQTVNELKAGVGEMIGDFQKAGAERKQTVNELKAEVGQGLRELRSGLRQAHQIRIGRGIKEVERRAKEPVIEKPPVEEAPVQKPKGTDAQTIEKIISRHPDGIRLVDMGNELGVNWRGLIGSTRFLVDQDRVEKIDNVYYPKEKGEPES